ncbi:MAG: hypothetical protein HZB50_18150 [Chloroflexi bacterium]|nr:hypothetical protein [Chloroflexota bacterium]
MSKENEKNYYSPVTIGLAVGVISFFVVATVSVFGWCIGIFISAGIGSIAGFLTARYANIGTWDIPANLGANAAAIAGVFVFLGHIAGGIIPSLLISRFSGSDVLPNIEFVSFGDIFSFFVRQGLINGAIGWFISAIAGSVVASKIYENDLRNKRN